MASLVLTARARAGGKAEMTSPTPSRRRADSRDPHPPTERLATTGTGDGGHCRRYRERGPRAAVAASARTFWAHVAQTRGGNSRRHRRRAGPDGGRHGPLAKDVRTPRALSHSVRLPRWRCHGAMGGVPTPRSSPSSRGLLRPSPIRADRWEVWHTAALQRGAAEYLDGARSRAPSREAVWRGRAGPSRRAEPERVPGAFVTHVLRPCGRASGRGRSFRTDGRTRHHQPVAVISTACGRRFGSTRGLDAR